MFENGPKISDPSKTHDTHFNLFHINGKLAKSAAVQTSIAFRST